MDRNAAAGLAFRSCGNDPPEGGDVTRGGNSAFQHPGAGPAASGGRRGSHGPCPPGSRVPPGAYRGPARRDGAARARPRRPAPAPPRSHAGRSIAGRVARHWRGPPRGPARPARPRRAARGGRGARGAGHGRRRRGPERWRRDPPCPCAASPWRASWRHRPAAPPPPPPPQRRPDRRPAWRRPSEPNSALAWRSIWRMDLTSPAPRVTCRGSYQRKHRWRWFMALCSGITNGMESRSASAIEPLWAAKVAPSCRQPCRRRMSGAPGAGRRAG